WAAGAERFWQVHDSEADPRLAQPNQRPYRSIRPFAAPRRYQIAHRLLAGRVVFVPLSEFARDVGFFWKSVSVAKRRSPEPVRTVVGDGWLEPDAHPCYRRILQRHAAAHWTGPGADQRSGPGDPR